ncbi:unnamed protein product [Dracunculus medinensis]|uniref:PDZ domain-containing protein n=1 Tax=Dracunculus medinensis TaxID=318479 RepID=A0A0N4U0S7_DRAME|nr:unnamed protein product [Dracunculus medinensis]
MSSLDSHERRELDNGNTIIELEKRENGFGFSIVGGIDNDHFPGNFGIFVSKVNDGGSAAESGRLKEGDRIISVNDKSLVDLTHDEAVAVLRNIPVNERAVLLIEPDAERNEIYLKYCFIIGIALHYVQQVFALCTSFSKTKSLLKFSKVEKIGYAFLVPHKSSYIERFIFIIAQPGKRSETSALTLEKNIYKTKTDKFEKPPNMATEEPTNIIQDTFQEYTQLNFSQNSRPSLNANRTEDIEKSEYISDSILDISPLKVDYFTFSPIAISLTEQPFSNTVYNIDKLLHAKKLISKDSTAKGLNHVVHLSGSRNTNLVENKEISSTVIFHSESGSGVQSDHVHLFSTKKRPVRSCSLIFNSDDRSFLPDPSIYSEVMEKFKEQNMEEQTEINREELSFSFDVTEDYADSAVEQKARSPIILDEEKENDELSQRAIIDDIPRTPKRAVITSFLDPMRFYLFH